MKHFIKGLRPRYHYKLLSLFVTLFIASFATAQTADEIISRHFEVTGGENTWNQLNSILIEGRVTIDVSDAVPIKIEHKRPYYKRVSYIVDGEEQLSEGFDGTNAFTYNNLDGGFKKLRGYKQDAFETDILNYKKKGFEAEKVSTEKVDGRNAYKIKLTKNTVQDYYWFDAENFNLIMEENELEVVRYSDFREVNGLTFAHRMEATPVGGLAYVVIFDKIMPNAAIDESRFKFEESE